MVGVVILLAGSLAEHLSKHSVEYIQFAFRWMNNLLMREFPLRCVIRLWDSYLVSGAPTTHPPTPTHPHPHTHTPTHTHTHPHTPTHTHTHTPTHINQEHKYTHQELIYWIDTHTHTHTHTPQVHLGLRLVIEQNVSVNFYTCTYGDFIPYCNVQSERDGFATFHVYVCAALLKWFSDEIQAQRDFQVCG